MPSASEVLKELKSAKSINDSTSKQEVKVKSETKKIKIPYLHIFYVFIILVVCYFAFFKKSVNVEDVVLDNNIVKITKEAELNYIKYRMLSEEKLASLINEGKIVNEDQLLKNYKVLQDKAYESAFSELMQNDEKNVSGNFSEQDTKKKIVSYLLSKAQGKKQIVE